MVKIWGKTNRILSSLFMRSKFRISKGCALRINKSLIYKTSIRIQGVNNELGLADNVKLYHTTIRVSGTNNSIEIDEDVILTSVNIRVWGHNNHIRIGKRTTMNAGTSITVCDGTRLFIGEDCMFSYDVAIRTSDGHEIRKDDVIINESSNVTILNNVWIGMRAMVLKSSVIPSGSIIGAKSLVNRELKYKSSMYAGIPVKLVRRDIEWTR